MIWCINKIIMHTLNICLSKLSKDKISGFLISGERTSVFCPLEKRCIRWQKLKELQDVNPNHPRRGLRLKFSLEFSPFLTESENTANEHYYKKLLLHPQNHWTWCAKMAETSELRVSPLLKSAGSAKITCVLEFGLYQNFNLMRT